MQNSYNVDKPYLSYKNVCLRRSDVDCLRDFNYLNDMCISFYYEYLNEKLKNYQNNFFLFDPASTSIIIFDEEIEDLYDMFGPLNLGSKDYLFMPINDNTNKYKIGGGSHWALLVYQKADDTFYYLDSMCNYVSNADILALKIEAIMKYEAKKSLNFNKSIKIENTLKNKFQLNNYDCGMFVLEFTETILNFLFSIDSVTNDFLDVEKINKILKSNVDQKNIKAKRTEIIKTINSLKNN